MTDKGLRHATTMLQTPDLMRLLVPCDISASLKLAGMCKASLSFATGFSRDVQVVEFPGSSSSMNHRNSSMAIAKETRVSSLQYP